MLLSTCFHKLYYVEGTLDLAKVDTNNYNNDFTKAKHGPYDLAVIVRIITKKKKKKIESFSLAVGCSALFLSRRRELKILTFHLVFIRSTFLKTFAN